MDNKGRIVWKIVLFKKVGGRGKVNVLIGTGAAWPEVKEKEQKTPKYEFTKEVEEDMKDEKD